MKSWHAKKIRRGILLGRMAAYHLITQDHEEVYRIRTVADSQPKLTREAFYREVGSYERRYF